MPKIPTLQTERLVLRPFALNDAADVKCLAGDFAVADTTQNIPHPYESGKAEQWIAQLQDQFDKATSVTFAITRRDNGQLLGAISLMNIENGHQAELGYWIGKPFWNGGFCTEAGMAVLKYAFMDLKLKRVHANHISRNPASGRVLLKLGFTQEGLRKQHVRKWDKLEDQQLYGLLEQDWQNSR